MFYQNSRRSARAALLCAASTLFLSVGFTSAIAAPQDEAAQGGPVQTGPSADADPQSVDELVITGSRIQNREEIKAREEATAIVDTLSRDDIGALPDVTIADSMRRIVGVTTIYNDDIGQFASVRGLHPDFIPVNLNGLAIATTGDLGEGTRRVNLGVMPGESVSQIQAYKTMSPELDAGALGGLINLVPVSAYDGAGDQLIITGSASYSTYMDVPDVNSGGDRKDKPYGGALNVLWSKRFGDAEQFGTVLSAFWQDRPRTQTNFATVGRAYYNAAGAVTTPESADWTGFAAPTQFTTHNYTNIFSKHGGTARFEYSPSDDFYASLFAFAYFSGEQETRNSNRLFSFDQPQNITENTGSLRVRSADTQRLFNTFERDQWVLQGQVRQAIGERGELNANVGYSYAWFQSERPFISFIYRPNTRVSYDLSNRFDPIVDLVNSANYLNPANFTLVDTYEDVREAEEDIWEGRIDYTFNNKRTDRGFGFATGVNYRALDLWRDNTSTNYANGRVMTGYALTPDFAIPGYFDRALWVDQKAFFAGVDAGLFPVDAALSSRLTSINDYRYQEDVLAAYAAANYTTDKANVSGGFRIDDVSFDATMASVVNGVLQATPVTKTGGDTHVLPYLTSVYSFTRQLRLKFAASQTLGRPNPSTIATVEDVDTANLTVTRGNPDIRPRQGTNFDLGVEKFFNDGMGMVTLTVFHKDIKDDILTITAVEQIGGQDYDVTQPVNGDGSTYQGVEVGVVTNSFGNLHPALQNIGASFNMMWVEGETTYTFNGQQRVRNDLLNQADTATNAAVFYSFGEGSEVRLAYNRQGNYVETIGAQPWGDVVSPPFATYDLTIKWAVAPSWQIGLEGRNIFDTDRTRRTGPNHEYERAILEIGSSWFLRATYRR